MPSPSSSSAPMSYFSATLDAQMQELGLTQQELFRRSGVPQSRISMYINAEGRPDTASLARLCRAFDDRGLDLLVAFLRDEVPPEMQEQIQITHSGGTPRVAEDPVLWPDRLPAKVRTLIADLARQCEQDPKMVAALEGIAGLCNR